MAERVPGGLGARSERFVHRGFAIDLVLPESAEALIDEAEFERDERLPYWAEVWPAARALTRYLLDRPPPAGPVLELGSGVALPALALRWLGVEVVATDYYPDALDFARANARSNHIPEPETLLLDWRVLPADFPKFRTVIAADVAYERRNSAALAAMLPQVTMPGGEVLISDPGRAFLQDLTGPLERSGWLSRTADTLTEPSPAGPPAPAVTVRIVSLRSPAAGA
jgi:predicted nicotinamide N-methyase